MPCIARTSETTHPAGWHSWPLGLCCLLCWCALAALRVPAQDAAQETPLASVKVWEFSPYEVEVLYLFDASISASPQAQQVWLAQVQADLERTFGAAWNVRLSPASSDLAPVLLRHFDNFTFADLQAQVATTKLTEQPVATESSDLSPSYDQAETATKRDQPAKAESLWRDRDKLFFMLVSGQGDET
ncbi:MAG: hypothetical protein ABI557_20295, partial [Aureliella sp.]